MFRVFFLILCLAFISSGCKVEGAADTYTWDFGKVKEGVILKHKFILKNESQNIMNIKDVNTSCDCTVSKVKKKTLKPQESTSLEVKFNTKGYSGPTKQFIYVHTDNLDKPILRFIIKADIKMKPKLTERQ